MLKSTSKTEKGKQINGLDRNLYFYMILKIVQIMCLKHGQNIFPALEKIREAIDNIPISNSVRDSINILDRAHSSEVSESDASRTKAMNYPNTAKNTDSDFSDVSLRSDSDSYYIPNRGDHVKVFWPTN